MTMGGRGPEPGPYRLDRRGSSGMCGTRAEAKSQLIARLADFPKSYQALAFEKSFLFSRN